ncbi:MAG: hypothetical protein CL840_17370 [Crocinitomicaceae bacterium]|nr:hypothetical protein [Crocinitomicaceae bacterium]|tara:strand:+ start:18001 stop:18501 length:501 start_codon:yes stop_codon:yes gene_type:complete
MSRPKTKNELLKLSQKNFKKLNQLIESFTPDEQQAEFPEGTMNRNIRDILCHLHHWHLMMAEWYTIGMSGEKPEMPAKGYTWKTTPELNRKIWEDYCSIGLSEAKKLVDQSYRSVQDIINAHSNEELFEKKRYKWTGTTSLGAYLISATSSHYDWAYKLIKKAKKD